ncbi:unnamed protein product, partial [Brenthis ino]
MNFDIVNQITNLYKQKDWKSIINTYRDHPDRNKLLWVFPTEENFEFIANCMVELKCDNILSIGCGSGLLEWIITEATGYTVSGVEVDGAWWHCKYAPPTFIPLLLTKPELDKDVVTLLRNRPGDGKDVFTDPKPFGDVPQEWTLHAVQEVGNSQDFIVVYCKRSS